MTYGRLAAGLLAVVAVSCDQGPDFDRQAMFASLVDVVMLPQYRAFDERAGTLSEATDALCASPSEATLTSARTAWSRARAAYLRTESHEFGPVMDERLDGQVDFRPPRTGTIEANIRSDEAITATWIEGFGVAGKGFAAIEYLLFAPGDEATTLATLVDAEGGANRRCLYLAAVVHDGARVASRMVAAWDPSGDDYRAALVDAGAGSDVYMDAHAVVSLLINRQLSVLEDVKLSRLGGPLGELETDPDPEAVESPWGGHDVAGMLATLRGVRSIWTGDFDGTEGIGLDEYVAAFDPVIATDFGQQLDNVIGVLEGVAPPLSQRIEEGSTSDAMAAYQALRTAERTLASDVAAAVSVTVTFTDNDGD